MRTPQSVLSTSMRGEDTSRCPPEGWHVMGLMSGTSVDGLDMASVRITRDGHSKAWNCEMKAFSTEAYPESLRARLWDAMQLDVESLSKLHVDWARWTSWMREPLAAGLPIDRSDLIGSHGHTVFHRLEEGWTFKLAAGRHCMQNSTFQWFVISGNLMWLPEDKVRHCPLGRLRIVWEMGCCTQFGWVCQSQHGRSHQGT